MEASDRQHYGLHLNCFMKWFAVEGPQEFKSLALRNSSKEPVIEGSNDISSFFHGQFKKYSAVLADKSYMLKVRQETAPELPDVEYLCNRIAEKLGIPVARFFCVEFMGNRTFVTQNFIEKTEHANLSHIHTHLTTGRVSNCETLIEVIETVTERFSDVETFIYTCLFDSLVGNHDRHGRNLGFIVTPRGSRLAPVYDNPSMLGLQEGVWLQADYNPQGRIPTAATQEPSIGDYVREFSRLGHSEQITIFAQRILVLEFISLIDESFCTDEMKQAMKRLLTKRVAELKNALSS